MKRRWVKVVLLVVAVLFAVVLVVAYCAIVAQVRISY